MIRSEKMILKKTDEISKWLIEATAIYNQTLYYLRQESFAAKKENRKIDYSKLDLYKLVKETSAWKSSDFDINAKQYVIRKVNDNWKSFCKACKAYTKNKDAFTGQPKMPKYLKHGRCAILTFDKTRLRHKDLKLNRLSLPKSEYLIQFPDYLQISKIKCITVKEYF